MSSYFSMNAWREILARVLDGFPAEDNVSPAWLINPATRRRLKLDRYYPDAGVAIRFVGLKAKGQGRQSDWEALETEQRDQTRAELCRLNGVQLALVDPNDEPIKQLDALTRVLVRASRLLAESQRSKQEKAKWMPALADARARASALRALVKKQPDQMMANLAESWRDRENGFTSAPPLDDIAKSNGRTKKRTDPLVFAAGMRVRHSHFGDGVVTKMNGRGDDATVSILFDGAEQKTFLASLLHGKIELLTN